MLHDYSDSNCIQILSQLAAAMSADSRVLNADQVLPTRAVLGEAVKGAVMDVVVVGMGGKERTEEGFREVLEGAGLELVRIWEVGGGGNGGGLVEGRLKGGGRGGVG